jgi:SAM-dependent methyltransferase
MTESGQGFDATWAAAYRRLDEQAADDVISHYGALLTRLSASFGRKIDALDVGCGTGRYFHCLRNVGRLVGIDPSSHMLERARTPVHHPEITVESIELMCGGLESVTFPDSSFDLIYSIGVVGEYAPVDPAFLRRCLRLLRSGGCLFVTAVDSRSRIAVPESQRPSLLRRLLRKSWPLLPVPLRVFVNHGLSPHYVTRRRLEHLFRTAGFARWQIDPYVHKAGWLGTHFDCTAIQV